MAVQSDLSRMLRGVLKIALAGVLMSLLGVFRTFNYQVTIGNSTVDLGVIVSIIIAVFPLLLLISAMNDLGVKL